MSNDESFSHTGYEPNNYFLTETYVESLTESTTGQRFLEQRFLEAEGESTNGQLKNQSSIMQEDYEEFISLTLRTRSSKKPSRMLARNWKHQWLPLCFARQARTVSMGRPVVNPMRSNQNLRVFFGSQ